MTNFIDKCCEILAWSPSLVRGFCLQITVHNITVVTRCFGSISQCCCVVVDGLCSGVLFPVRGLGLPSRLHFIQVISVV